MKNFIIWLTITLVVWIFPARWGANYFFPEVVAQYGSQVPWIMVWGAVMFLLANVVLIFIGHDD